MYTWMGYNSYIVMVMTLHITMTRKLPPKTSRIPNASPDSLSDIKMTSRLYWMTNRLQKDGCMQFRIFVQEFLSWFGIVKLTISVVLKIILLNSQY